MPPYLIGDSDIDPKFLNIQKIYDSLYLDDGKEFKYIGFKEAEKRENFFRELLLVINLLKNKLNDEYIIEDSVKESRGQPKSDALKQVTCKGNF